MSEVGVPWETDSEMSVQAYGGALGIPPGGTGSNKMRQREGGWVPWEVDLRRFMTRTFISTFWILPRKKGGRMVGRKS